MSQKIEPALTPDEWAGERVRFPQPEGYSDWIEGGYYIAGEEYDEDAGAVVYELEVEGCDRDTPLQRRHALAALALHGQPFGFTWMDAAILEDAIEYLEKDALSPESELRDLLHRIESLLPPGKP